MERFYIKVTAARPGVIEPVEYVHFGFDGALPKSTRIFIKIFHSVKTEMSVSLMYNAHLQHLYRSLGYFNS